MTGNSAIDGRKKAMRETMRGRREQLSQALRSNAAQRIAERGLDFLNTPGDAIVSGYVALADEIDPLGLMEQIAAQGHRLCLPVVKAKSSPLIFREWSPGAALTEAAYGLQEPLPSAAEVEPDILLVPLLAFDRAGYRLGFGAGFYDRTLEPLRARKTVQAVGLAFSEQEVEMVPHDGYDQPLNWILTPRETIRAERD